MVKIALGWICEGVFCLTRIYEKLMAWHLGRRQQKESVRYVWIHRREAAEGTLGLHLRQQRPSVFREASGRVAWFLLGWFALWLSRRAEGIL